MEKETSPQPKGNPPRIDVRISTSSSTFDLSSPTPFTITLTLVLNHSSPITFKRRSAGLFDHLLLYDDGLSFTDVETGKRIPRGHLYICGWGGTDNTPDWRHRAQFVTLYPGQEHTIPAEFSPVRYKPEVRRDNATMATEAQKAVENGNEELEVPKWYNIDGLEDGHAYEIGVSETAVIQGWWEGSLMWLIGQNALTAWLGWEPQVRDEAIGYRVVVSARFKVRRPEREWSYHGLSDD